MAEATTIKVSVGLRDRLAEIARNRDTTLAGAIEYLLDVADEAEFWNQVRRTMLPGGGSAGAERYVGALADGLDREDWSGLS
jgi:hypothetical protein